MLAFQGRSCVLCFVHVVSLPLTSIPVYPLVIISPHRPRALPAKKDKLLAQFQRVYNKVENVRSGGAGLPLYIIKPSGYGTQEPDQAGNHLRALKEGITEHKKP